MLPQRPAGVPPPSSAGGPCGSSPAVSPVGKPPGPPPGPPPGAPGSAPLKSLPRSPPPAKAQNAVPHARDPSQGVPPSSAEAKAPVLGSATPTKKAPPPPRVGSPPVSPPPQDKKVSTISPRPPPGKPPERTYRAVAPGSPSVDGKTISKTRSPVSGVAEAVAPSAEGMAENAWRDQSKSGTGVEKGVSSSPRGDGTKSGAPESAKAPESPAPSPKAPPGVPVGMAPPSTPPPGKSLSTSKPGLDDKAETSEESGQGGSVKAPSGQSPQATPTAAGRSPPGRRPPPGPPPGKRPSSPIPARARSSPPPVEELAVLTSKEEEATSVTGKESPPRSPEGLPPPESLSDGHGDESDKSTGGRVGEASHVDMKVAGHTAKELEVVRPGRLTVRCIAGEDVLKSTLSKRPRTADAYLKITLGRQKGAPAKRSQVVKKCGVSPGFGSERIAFDIVEPAEFIVEGDVSLIMELWDESARADDKLGSIQVSALRFMHPEAVPREEWFTLEAPSGRNEDRAKVLVEMSFERALVGMFVLTLFEGEGLGEKDPLARRNPYVVATMGETYQKRSGVAKKGGSTPFFGEEEIILWIDNENWINDLRIQVRSEDIGTDAELGAATISVLRAMTMPPDNPREEKLELSLQGEPSGSLLVKSAFLPAGKLTLVCKAGRRLRDTSLKGRMDPYVVFRADGQAMSLSRRTKIDKDGGTDPRWDDTMKFDIVDQYNLRVECFDHDLLESDKIIGRAECSLLPAFKRGTMDTWIELTASQGSGPPKPAGEIHCVFSFVGPPGLAYPQHQPGVDSFDDSLRLNLPEHYEEANYEDRQGSTEVNDAIVVSHDREPFQRSAEFSDEEIAAAFKCLDLDRNKHMGAAEIRHILLCMGELVTDEEIDMMISIADADGDGQVSYEDFHRVVIDPDPSRHDFGTDITKTQPKEAGTAPTQEAEEREGKRWLLGEFVKENEIHAIDLEKAYKRFRDIVPATDVVGGGSLPMEMDFNTWMTIFDVEATGQYRKLFKLYNVTKGAREGEERVDIRQFFLGMANFVEWPLEQRSQFVFTLFDENHRGFLSMDELVQVLKASHIASAKAVSMKAQTIMRQAEADGYGDLTVDEFVVVAKKFPNLLFPTKKQPGKS